MIFLNYRGGRDVLINIKRFAVMKIVTGKAPMSLFTLVAILSLSLVVNLPGLAISPMLGSLSKIFPGTGSLEQQLLTMLPNLLIIPCLLLSGWLARRKNKIGYVVASLVLFTGCGVAYMFAASMAELIVISCLLGIAAGILIPFSTGLLADTFAGRYRMRQMGLQSGISNLSVVVATFAVGFLSRGGNWHMPFIVYLMPLIPLALSVGLRGIPAADYAVAAPTAIPAPHGSIIVPRMLGIAAAYFFTTYATVIITYFCPFLIEKEHWSPEITGTVTSIYFLFIFLPGFILPQILKATRGMTIVAAAALITAGLALFSFVHAEWAMMAGAALMGAGYGIHQPIIYNKAPETVTDPSMNTMSLSLVLVANYAAISAAPLIVDSLRSLLGAGGVTGFAFLLNFAMSIVFLAIAILRRKHFSFSC